jgi:lipid II:glycine glycyltransferase (peptidoglycan interpeptide bridge formation enzyme)
MSQLTISEWNQFLDQFPNAHLLQTSRWGLLKSDFGWKTAYFANQHAGAQVLLKPLPFGFKIAYIPKGPVGDDWSALLFEIDAFCKKEHVVFLKIEPDFYDAEEINVKEFLSAFRISNTIQPRRTIVVDLQGSEDECLKRMKQKWRYNVRLAERKEIKITVSEDFNTFYDLMQETGERDAFGVHSKEYYKRALDLFKTEGEGAILLAEYEGIPLAAIMIFAKGQRAWYFYGASSNRERNRMPTYLLQWEAMRWAKEKGCLWYDLWGIPDADEDELERNFQQRTDGLWQVYRFKRGFGGEVKRFASGYDRVYHPALYALYRLRVKG